MMIKVNDILPSAKVYQNNDKEPFDAVELFHQGLVVIFGLPAAFSPTCTESHLPGFVRESANLKARRVTTIACISVNDRFVMNAWGVQMGAMDAGITMISDVNAEFTRAIGADIDLSAVGLGTRSTRYALIVQNGTVRHVAEDAPGKLETSSAEAILDMLDKL